MSTAWSDLGLDWWFGWPVSLAIFTPVVMILYLAEDREKQLANQARP